MSEKTKLLIHQTKIKDTLSRRRMEYEESEWFVTKAVARSYIENLPKLFIRELNILKTESFK